MKLVWFRNDLRTGDHHALYQACMDNTGEGVLGVAIITPVQWKIQDESKSRVQFWRANLESLSCDLQSLNIPLLILRAPSNREIPALLVELAKRYQVSGVYFNREYPLYEQQRDNAVISAMTEISVPCLSFDSDVVLPAGTVLNQQGLPFKVFTPFSKRWRQQYLTSNPQPLPVPPVQAKLDISTDSVPKEIGYPITVGADWSSERWPAGTEAAHKLLQHFVLEKVADYKQSRDFPAEPGTSSLSPYLSVGVLSTRQCLAAMQAYSDQPEWFDSQWVTELIWREFYRHLLVLFPEMNRWEPFKPEVEEKLSWQYDESLFQAWCQGETGFAIVDAGMKELLETGWMHNRVRMITASFLTKLLRQDWRLGARFFMQHLIDGDFASNLGGWQWSASVGADAAPYFRIFNPMRQAERFDAKGKYVGQYVPSLQGLTSVQQHDPMFAASYSRPTPIIDYAYERQYSLDAYKAKS